MRFYLYMNDWLCKDKKIFAMTLFEILNFNRELLERLTRVGLKPDDYKYIDLYVLSIRHGVCERKIYEIVGRFKKECTFHAV